MTERAKLIVKDCAAAGVMLFGDQAQTDWKASTPLKYRDVVAAAIERFDSGETVPTVAGAPPSATPASGEWVTVPREPTNAMIDAIPRGSVSAREIYRAILAAAPQQGQAPLTHGDAALLPGLREALKWKPNTPQLENAMTYAWESAIKSFIGALERAEPAPRVEAPATGAMAHILAEKVIEEWRQSFISGRDPRYDKQAIEGNALCDMAEKWRQHEVAALSAPRVEAPAIGLSQREIDLTEAAYDLLVACEMEDENEAILHGKPGKAWNGDYVSKQRLDAMTRVRALADPNRPVVQPEPNMKPGHTP